MFKNELKKLSKEPCLRMDYKSDLEDNKAAWHYFRTKYPSLFKGMESYNFHLPRGWRRLCEAVFAFLDKSGVRIVQVKQKMGELRIYTEKECEGECKRLIQMAEALAKATCEFCGGVDNVTVFQVGYVCRVCEECKVAMCEYTLMNWILNGQKEVMNDAQMYCLRQLRELNNEELSRVAGQDN